MPNRIIRDWTDSERINNLSAGAEVLLNRIIISVDNKGRIKCHPKVLRGICFPLKKISDAIMLGWIKELSDNELISFNDDGKTISLVRSNISRQRLCASQWILLVRQVFERDNYTCSYCGQYGGKLECDHIIPFSKGGSDDVSNLTTACKKCNQLKKDLSVEEFLIKKANK